MGNKVSSTGFRVGITKDWKSKWFYPKASFGDYVIEDEKIRRFLRKKLRTAGVEDILIERNINDLKVTLKVAKPGFVIGRGGAGVTLLQEALKKFTKSKVSISVEEVRYPEVSAPIVANDIASQVERRVHYKRAVLSAIRKAMDQGALGIKVIVSGVLSGANTISRSETYKEGKVPLTTLRANLDYGEKPAVTTYGVIGIRVWIYKKD